MKHSLMSVLGLPAILLLFAASLLGMEGLDENAPRVVKNMRMPLAYYEDGTVKSQLIAAEAKIPGGEEQVVKATKIRAEFYSLAGKLETLVLADDCIYDRQSGMVSSDGKVRLERPDAVITGKGFRWDSKSERIAILDKTRVVLERGLGVGKVLKK